jgi:hypothetical protein
MNVVSQIASDDQYHYGFNGQMKTNEWAGVGNHNTALFWEYDTRTGRRLKQDPRPNPSISNYSAFGNNPIWHSDPLGDTLKASPQANEKLQEGLNATLGEGNNPFGYDPTQSKLILKEKVDRSRYSSLQLDLIDRYEYFITSKTDNVNVEMVDQDQKLPDILDRATKKPSSLEDISSDGVTAPLKVKNGVRFQNVYVSRNPKEGPLRDRRLSFNDWLPGITAIHELAGHAYLTVAKPKQSMIDQNREVTRFENNIRAIYIIDKKGNTIPGKSIPHINE